MKKRNWLRTIAATAILGTTLLSAAYGKADAAESSYSVKKDDTLWKISTKSGVSINQIKHVNNLKNTIIYPGQQLTIPQSLTASDKDLLARLVTAEAKGEPYAGQVAVATVVLNRVDSDEFPDSVHDVIYQNYKGHYAFSPVENGAINQSAKDEAVKAVNEAIAYRGMGNGSLYFYNPATSTSDWIYSTKTILTIGHHRFAK
ncbi:cell wall hydrolase [Falsibacillus pallidus]|uniref:cell wall hydrolase n=1 Tax=Falsibacillus pallidus TaxID=493781 RepID=UPI003D96A21F